MNKEQEKRNKLIFRSLLVVSILLLAYSTILSIHFKIPNRILAEIEGKTFIANSSWIKMYESEVLLSEKAIKKPDIVMLGDSITYGAQWNDDFLPTIFNRGIAGDRTKGVLHRLDSVIRTKPSKIFLMIGINDINDGTSNDIITENIISIIKIIKKKSITPYVQSILHVTKKYNRGISSAETINNNVDTINRNISKYCIENNIAYIDLNPLLSNGNKYLNAEYSYDNIHLNNKGYEIWINKIKSLIGPVQ